MTQSRNPPTKPSIPVPRSASVSSPPRDNEIPRGDFIDVLTNKPVEPARLQVFPVPEEFLNKVLASEPPRLRPEDFRDTVPQGLPSMRPAEPMPASATACIASSDEPPRPDVASARNPTDHPRPAVALKTVPPRARRSPSLLTRWALTGRLPTSFKVTLAVIIGALLLLLLWQNWDSFTGAPDTDRAAAAEPAASVPLLEPPAAMESSEVREVEPPALTHATSEPVAADLPLPQPSHVAQPAEKMNKPSEPAPPAVSNSASRAAAVKRSPKLTPIFEPR